MARQQPASCDKCQYGDLRILVEISRRVRLDLAAQEQRGCELEARLVVVRILLQAALEFRDAPRGFRSTRVADYRRENAMQRLPGEESAGASFQRIDGTTWTTEGPASRIRCLAPLPLQWHAERAVPAKWWSVSPVLSTFAREIITMPTKQRRYVDFQEVKRVGLKKVSGTVFWLLRTTAGAERALSARAVGRAALRAPAFGRIVTMRALIFDPFAGISGDMTLAALLDIGLEEEWLRSFIADLGIGDIAVHIERVDRRGIAAPHVRGTRTFHPTTQERFVLALDIIQAVVSPSTGELVIAFADARLDSVRKTISVVWSRDGRSWSQPADASRAPGHTAWLPAVSRSAMACRRGYASLVRICFRVTKPAVIDSGLPLKVPRWATRVAPPGIVECSMPLPGSDPTAPPMPAKCWLQRRFVTSWLSSMTLSAHSRSSLACPSPPTCR